MVFCNPKQLMVFQFHKGTIRTDTYYESPEGFAGFQFHKGTIRTEFKAENIREGYISIP